MAEVTREHRRLALLAQGYGTKYSQIPAGSDMENWLETGAYPGNRPMGSDVIAQALADAEARGLAASSAEVTRLEGEVERLERQLKKAWVQLMGKGDAVASAELLEASLAALAPNAKELEADIAIIRKSLPVSGKRWATSRDALDRIAAALGVKL